MDVRELHVNGSLINVNVLYETGCIKKMIDWSDLNVFRVLIERGTVREAATVLNMGHATVARKIDALEKRLGVKLFLKDKQTYVLTDTGRDLLSTSLSIHESILGLERRIGGENKRVSGTVRLTTIDVVATHLLVPILRDFTQDYPDIHIIVDHSYRQRSFEKLQTDLAIRHTNIPPESLIAKKLGDTYSSVYAHKDYLSHDCLNLDDSSQASWVGRGTPNEDIEWIKKSPFPHLKPRYSFHDMNTQLYAVKGMLGIGFLPCFVCDQEETLTRIHDNVMHDHRSLWLLKHPDTRQSSKLRIVSEYLVDRFHKMKGLLEGLSVPGRDRLGPH